MNRSTATLLTACLALTAQSARAQSSTNSLLEAPFSLSPRATASDTTAEAASDRSDSQGSRRPIAPVDANAWGPPPAPAAAEPAEPATKAATLEAPATENKASRPTSAENFDSVPGQWKIAVMPYAWLPWIDASLAGSEEIHISAGDVLEDLKFFAEGSISGKKDNSPWGFFLDYVYFNLHDNSVKLKAQLFSAMVTYGLDVNTEGLEVDLMAGARYVSLAVDVGDGPIGGTVDWIDPLLGVNTTYQLNDKWSLQGYLDGGAFNLGDGSKFTYQTMATVHYEFSDKLQGMAGFRYLNIYQKDAMDFDGDIYGPIMGLKINL